MNVKYFDRQGREVPQEVACGPSGFIRDGFSVQPQVMVMDGTSGRHLVLDSHERSSVIARARRIHDLKHAHEGAGARPFTDADAERAVAARLAEKTSAGPVPGSQEIVRLRAMSEGARVARNVMRTEAWK